MLWSSDRSECFNTPGCELARDLRWVGHLLAADSQRLRSQATLEAVLFANPWLGIAVTFTVGLSLLLACLPGGWECPVDQGEPTEDEEHPSPPQDLLALSVQHVAQDGLWERQV